MDQAEMNRLYTGQGQGYQNQLSQSTQAGEPASETVAAFYARMIALVGPPTNTVRYVDLLRLCQMAAKGL